ncbi:MAG TPA: AI-2E family transporter [Acidimicrobiia bacterium]|nr:AI-2E family transporter [Acidimicrobiia bacterium]
MPGERESGLRRVGVAAWSLLGTLLLLAASVWLLTRIWIIVPPLVFAIAMIYVLNPIVNRLASHGVARWLGSCLSYLVLVGLLTLAGILAIPRIADQASELAEDFPGIYDDMVMDIENFAADLGLDDVDLPDYDQLQEEISENGLVRDNLRRITEVTLGVLETILLLTLAPVIAFYVLLDLPTMRRKTMELIPEARRAEIAYVGRELGTAVGGFLRGQLLVALIVGVMTSVGFWLVGLPFWLLIGMIAGFLNIIPFVGPWVGGILGVLVALATSDLQTALWAGLVALIVQQIDNHFVSPTVLRATVRLHPAAIVLGLVVGAAIGGFWGVLLTVPIMAAVKIVAGHYWRTRVLGESWEEASEALIDDDPEPDTVITRALDGLDRDEE